jgi:hypothetical protein
MLTDFVMRMMHCLCSVPATLNVTSMHFSLVRSTHLVPTGSAHVQADACLRPGMVTVLCGWTHTLVWVLMMGRSRY